MHLYIIGGPNGAGKTTCAMTLLPEFLHIKHFVNADLIAKGLSPFEPILADLQASKIMVERMNELRKQKECFAVETTLASRSIAKFINDSKLLGYETCLIYIALDNPETAKQRVALRVAKGGHNILETTIERRYYSGLKNLFEVYMPLVDSWRILDNTRSEKAAEIIAQKFINEEPVILNSETFLKLKRSANNE
jgi:predicted ABC-type ATPase